MPSSNDHEYDANLLLATPIPTKGMLQSGYATDLLEDKQPKPSRRDDLESGRHKSVSKHTSSQSGPKVAARGSAEPKLASTTSIPKPSPQKTPFYRTRKGIIILVIAGFVILAAIIGGAVGGASKNKNTAISNQQVATLAPPSTSSAASPSADGSQGNGNVASGTPPFSGVSPRVSGSATTVVSTLVNTVTVGIASGLASFPSVTPLPQNP